MVPIAFNCPRCGYSIDAASPAQGGEATPAPGDLTVCLRCAAPMQFEADATPRWLTFEEFGALPPTARAELGAAIISVLTLRPGRRLVKAV